jgi:hypothetical protein
MHREIVRGEQTSEQRPRQADRWEGLGEERRSLPPRFE